MLATVMIDADQQRENKTRRERLRLLIDRDFGGNQTRFALRVGSLQPAINHILTGEKNLGANRARKWERELGLPRYYFDIEHSAVATEIRDQPLSDTRPVPLLSFRQAAEWASHVAEAKTTWPGPPGSSSDTFAVRVEGEMLEPEFFEGEVLYVDPNVAPKSGAYVIVKRPDEPATICRQLTIEAGHRYLVHPNPSWPERVTEIGHAEIVGVVIAQLRDRR